MSTTGIKAIPDGMHSVTPHLICAGAAEAIDVLQAGVRGGRIDADAGGRPASCCMPVCGSATRW